MYKIFIRYYQYGFVILIVLVACQPTNQIIPVTRSPKPSNQLTSTAISNPIMSTSPFPTLVSELEPIITTPTTVLLSPTSTAIQLPPAPTLTNEQKAIMLKELMVTNGGCDLPCWWGIVPGQAEIDGLAAEFLPKGLILWDEGKRLVGGIYYTIQVIFETEGDVIQSIGVKGSSYQSGLPASDWEHYFLDSILIKLGQPALVQIFSPWRPDPGLLSYDLFLFYPELGIVVEYVGLAEEIGLGTGRACPHTAQLNTINLTLFAPSQLTLEGMVEMIIPIQDIVPTALAEVLYERTRLENATDLSLEQFYQTLQNREDPVCFDFVSYWQK